MVVSKKLIAAVKLSPEPAYKIAWAAKPLTRKEAMLAHCYECMGGYDEGKQDCLGKSCPLYRYYPYKKVQGDT